MAAQGFACQPYVEPQARLRARAELHTAELVSVLVDPRAFDAQLGRQRRRVDQPATRRRIALTAHQLNHTARNGLHRRRIERRAEGVMSGFTWWLALSATGHLLNDHDSPEPANKFRRRPIQRA